jgi:hypothetical protein
MRRYAVLLSFFFQLMFFTICLYKKLKNYFAPATTARRHGRRRAL